VRPFAHGAKPDRERETAFCKDTIAVSVARNWPTPGLFRLGRLVAPIDDNISWEKRDIDK
jgi:hypothetical protein